MNEDLTPMFFYVTPMFFYCLQTEIPENLVP